MMRRLLSFCMPTMIRHRPTPVLYLAWKAAGKPAELHSYADGGHGFGMPARGRSTDNWIERFGDWLRYQQLLR
jgi:hypothetical protein